MSLQNNASMLDCINSEFGGNARRIMALLIMGNKSESEEVGNPLKERDGNAWVVIG